VGPEAAAVAEAVAVAEVAVAVAVAAEAVAVEVEAVEGPANLETHPVLDRSSGLSGHSRRRS
jgi:hypothetical protein